MAFCREIHYVVGVRDQLFDEPAVADVSLHESIAFVILDVKKIRGVAGVGELIDVDYTCVRDVPEANER